MSDKYIIITDAVDDSYTNGDVGRIEEMDDEGVCTVEWLTNVPGYGDGPRETIVLLREYEMLEHTTDSEGRVANVGDRICVVAPDDNSIDEGFEPGDFATVTNLHYASNNKWVYEVSVDGKEEALEDCGLYDSEFRVVDREQIEEQTVTEPLFKVGERVILDRPDAQSLSTGMESGMLGTVREVTEVMWGMHTADVNWDNGREYAVYETEISLHVQSTTKVMKGDRIVVTNPDHGSSYEKGDRGVATCDAETEGNGTCIKFDNGQEYYLARREFEIVHEETSLEARITQPQNLPRVSVGDMVKTTKTTTHFARGDLARVIHVGSGALTVEWIATEKLNSTIHISPNDCEIVK